MKQMIAVILWAIFTHSALAQSSEPLVLQLKYSPLATINNGEDTLDDLVGNDQQYDVNYDHTLGAKLIYNPVYFAVQHNIAKLDNSTSDATLETISLGLAGFNYERLAGLYLMGSVGIGTGQFKFEESEANEWEILLEGSAEIGFHLQERFLLGMGVDYQRFGELGDHKANYWNLYLSTGIVF